MIADYKAENSNVHRKTITIIERTKRLNSVFVPLHLSFLSLLQIKEVEHL